MLNNNPQAFPFYLERQYEEPGMTLRDYFAGQAIIGLLSMEQTRYHSIREYPANPSEAAYVVADNMLSEREKWNQ